MKNVVTVNGQRYEGGSSVVVSGGRVLIDGRDVTPEGKTINIEVSGNITNLDVDACQHVSVTGDVQTAKVGSGNLIVTGNVSGDARVMTGDVNVGGDVRGKVNTSVGNVSAKG